MKHPKGICNLNKCYGGPCKECGKCNEGYMVKDKIWKKYGTGRGLLCIPCLEFNIGRKLIIKDFTDAPINYGFFGFNKFEYINKGIK